ncbi:uncharacterized protein UV8b_08182 [Ustilaginoidea virens]|uniref:Uncharacterized protein n=1 Tax=Ustilaginoidea virens TaxID=1159556 RepID=A0A8E5MLA0_USTVR|nr:uncharacterized protein UV8b_08182 [Ustilaginoidea virens]QUC23941.1 hypothetical protein UV8b_08182 [Ustilaginoidea virens]
MDKCRAQSARSPLGARLSYARGGTAAAAGGVESEENGTRAAVARESSLARLAARDIMYEPSRTPLAVGSATTLRRPLCREVVCPILDYVLDGPPSFADEHEHGSFAARSRRVCRSKPPTISNSRGDGWG